MKDEKKWYVIYTKTKLEKKTVETFEKKQIPVYLPECSKIHSLHGKQRVVKVPLLPSLFFAFLTEQQLEKIINIHGVAGILYKLHKPATIKSKEIDAMQIFLTTHSNVTVEKVPMGICNEYNSFESGNFDKVAIDMTYGTEKLMLPSLGYCLAAKSSEVLATNVA